MQFLQNKTLVAFGDNTNELKASDSQQQSSFLDDPSVTLKDDRGKTFSVDKDIVDFFANNGLTNKLTFRINISRSKFEQI